MFHNRAQIAARRAAEIGNLGRLHGFGDDDGAKAIWRRNRGAAIEEWRRQDTWLKALSRFQYVFNRLLGTRGDSRH